VLPSWVPVIAIGKDLVTVLGFGLVYVTTGRFFIHPRPLGKVCTVVQLVMIAAALAYPDLPAVARELPRLAWWVASVLAGAAVIDYVFLGNRFAKSVAREARERESTE
jgi:phosphatidylglycerophosphate synthase